MLLITQINKQKEIKLILEDESFTEDIVNDLKKSFNFKIKFIENLILIKPRKKIRIDFDLFEKLINGIVEYYNSITYMCQCGHYEYITKEERCNKCNGLVCDNCKNITFGDDCICDNCLELQNEQDFDDFI